MAGKDKTVNRLRRKVKKLQHDIQVLKFMLEGKERQIDKLSGELNGKNEEEMDGTTGHVGESSVGEGIGGDVDGNGHGQRAGDTASDGPSEEVG